MYLVAPCWSSAPNSLGHHFSSTGLLPAIALPEKAQAAAAVTAIDFSMKCMKVSPNGVMVVRGAILMARCDLRSHASYCQGKDCVRSRAFIVAAQSQRSRISACKKPVRRQFPAHLADMQESAHFLSGVAI